MLTAGQKMMINIFKCLWKGRELVSSLLFPARCLVCDEILEPEEQENGIHSACINKLYPIQGAVCMHCGRPIGENYPKAILYEYCYDCVEKKYHKASNIKQAKALYLYCGAIKKSMYRFKYGNKREYAKVLAKQAIERYGDWIKQTGAEAIVPVPIHPKKRRKRGYNQAESFAQELSCLSGIPVEKDWVVRVKNTVAQKELGAQARKNNLKNAFHSGKSVVQCKCVMVVDDIYTTGSTAEAVAQEMIKQGAHRVYLLTICIGGDM